MTVLQSQVVRGQDSFPNPELRQMYETGQDYIHLKNYNRAATIFRQGLVLAPGNKYFRYGLAEASYLYGDYATTEATLNEKPGIPGEDWNGYHFLALAQAAQNKFKDAGKTLSAGLERLPESGQLWYDQGLVYQQKHEPEHALDAWTKGIDKAPFFAENYMAVSAIMLRQSNYAFGLVLLEIFLNLPHQATGDDSLKSLLFHTYIYMMDSAGWGGVPKPPAGRSPYSDALQTTYSSLTPVVSEGVTTENLAMLRARFLMHWQTQYGKQLPDGLFTYLLQLMAEGKFDIYNEWLFGKAENVPQFIAWNAFHPGDIDRFLAWRARHPFIPGKLHLEEIRHGERR